MKKYNSPKMEIVLYALDDVVTASPVVDWGACPYSFDDSDGF